MSKKIPKGWKKVRLGEVVITNPENIGKSYPYKEILYLDTGSIIRGKIKVLQIFQSTEAPGRAKRIVKSEDIIYSTVRPIQRHYGFILNPPKNLIVSTGFVVIRVQSKKVIPQFVYYFLTLNEIVEILDAIADGSTSAYPSLSHQILKILKSKFPNP